MFADLSFWDMSHRIWYHKTPVIIREYNTISGKYKVKAFKYFITIKRLENQNVCFD